MNEKLTVWLDLPGDRQVRVDIAVNTGPAIPTPHEPDVIRVPRVHEWPEIISRLSCLEATRIETTPIACHE